jgi:hypothetical protein
MISFINSLSYISIDIRRAKVSREISTRDETALEAIARSDQSVVRDFRGEHESLAKKL